MINLQQQLNAKLYEIIMLDGSEMYLKAPTQALLMDLVAIKDIDTGDIKADLKAIAALTLRILNRNTEDKLFEISYVTDNFDVKADVAIIQDYLAFFYGDLQKKS